jgi:hypothetical protein
MAKKNSNVNRLPGWNARRGVGAAITILEPIVAGSEESEEVKLRVSLAVELCQAALEGRDVSFEARAKLYQVTTGQQQWVNVMDTSENGVLAHWQHDLEQCATRFENDHPLATELVRGISREIASIRESLLGEKS